MEQDPDIIVGFNSPEDAAKVAEHISDARVTHNVLYVPEGDPIAIQQAALLEDIPLSSLQINSMASASPDDLQYEEE